jgi:hypothetical protein
MVAIELGTWRCGLIGGAAGSVTGGKGIENFLDAKRVLDVLGKRFARYGLSLHPDKTRFVDFRNNRGSGKSGCRGGIVGVGSSAFGRYS